MKAIVLKSIINIASILLIPIILSMTFSRVEQGIDENHSKSIKMHGKDIIIIAVISLIYNAVSITLLSSNSEKFIITALLFGYLIFMAYTDQKTMMVYSAPSVIMLVALILRALIQNKMIHGSISTQQLYIILPVMIVLLILSMFGMLGYGDILIYAVIAVYNIIYSDYAGISLIINLLIANTLFILTMIILRLKKSSVNTSISDGTTEFPFTIYILIGTIICSILNI